MFVESSLFNGSPSCHLVPFQYIFQMHQLVFRTEWTMVLATWAYPHAYREASKLLSTQSSTADSSHLHFWALTPKSTFWLMPALPIFTAFSSPALQNWEYSHPRFPGPALDLTSWTSANCFHVCSLCLITDSRLSLGTQTFSLALGQGVSIQFPWHQPLSLCFT